MDKQTAATLFESLSSAVRLDVFRLLVKLAPIGLVAGEIATELQLPPTNLSFHLKAMTYAELQHDRERFKVELDRIGKLS